MKKVSIIDLGTNTAHLLIAEQIEGGLKVLKKKRHYTFLAESGIEQITIEAQKRLFFALANFDLIVKEFKSPNCVIIGTEAFRIAKNGGEILRNIKQEYGWDVEIVSGNREAILIYEGVRQVVNLSVGNFVIMDIGGGSVEFVISKNGKLEWKKSFPIGIAKIFNNFFSNNSLTSRDLLKHSEKIRNVFLPLEIALKKYNPVTLVGAAGSFEILIKKTNDSGSQVLNKDVFLNKMEEIINLSEEERARVSWIPEERAKYVTAAILLIRIALDITNSKKIIVSPFSLKEGLAAEWFEKQKAKRT